MSDVFEREEEVKGKMEEIWESAILVTLGLDNVWVSSFAARAGVLRVSFCFLIAKGTEALLTLLFFYFYRCVSFDILAFFFS